MELVGFGRSGSAIETALKAQTISAPIKRADPRMLMEPENLN
jgi:hypothetical protein